MLLTAGSHPHRPPTEHTAADGRALTVFHRSRCQLLEQGWNGRRLAAAVRDGRLIRARNDVYLAPDAHPDLVDACRVGGRLACVSELTRRGIFVLDSSVLHLQLGPHNSHVRHIGRPLRRHWQSGTRSPHPRSTSVEVVDAVIQSVTCQGPSAAIATLDSALHLGAIDEDDLDHIFGALPRKYRLLRRYLDGRAESGPESLVRLMLRRLGCRVEVQVVFTGIGRVDLVVDGWLVIECDSEAHHGGWAAQKRDRRRDQDLAALGYAVYRPIAEDIMWNPEAVVAALKGLLRVPNRSGGRR